MVEQLKRQIPPSKLGWLNQGTTILFIVKRIGI